MSYFLNEQIPWKTIMITGHTLDGNGDKFSKSSGNATAPKPLSERYGASGLRHWAASNTLGLDTRIDEDKMKMGWRMNNKFKNAQKFIQMQIDNGYIGEDDSLMEIWLEQKSSILESFEQMEFHEALDKIYKFFWNIFCDQWIESSKSKPTSITLKKIIEDFEPIFMIIYE